MAHSQIAIPHLTITSYLCKYFLFLYINKRYRPNIAMHHQTWSYKIVVQTCGKRRDLLNYMFFLNLEFLRLLILLSYVSLNMFQTDSSGWLEWWCNCSLVSSKAKGRNSNPIRPGHPFAECTDFSAGDEKSLWYGIFYAVTWWWTYETWNLGHVF